MLQKSVIIVMAWHFPGFITHRGGRHRGINTWKCEEIVANIRNWFAQGR